MTEPVSVEEMKRLGMVFPTCWIGAVLSVDLEPAKIRGFYGTATILGDDLFLTARHVLDDAVADGGTVCVIVTDPDTNEKRVTVAQVYDPHPSVGVDLALGKYWWPDDAGDPLDLGHPFAGWGLATGWADVKVIGYPDELVGQTRLRQYGFDARFLKGHVTRSLVPGDHFQVDAQALELSFPIPKGMSGSPVFLEQTGGRYIGGIAVGSIEIATVHHRTLSELEEGKPLREEREQRIVEAGIAVRTSAYLDWAPDILQGKKLGDLLTNREEVAAEDEHP